MVLSVILPGGGDNSVAVGFTIRTHFPVLECDFLYLFTKYSIEIRLRCLFKFRKSIG